MEPSPRTRRILACLLGYGLAILVALAAVWLKNLGLTRDEQDASSGMLAFADLVCFVLVASLAAIPSTVGLMSLVEPGPRWAACYAAGSLALAASAPAAALALVLPDGAPGTGLAVVQALAVVRLLGAPAALLVHLPGLVLGPGGRRLPFAAACGLEVAALAAFVLQLALRAR